MSKIINLSGYVENGQFAGGLATTGSNTEYLPFTAGGIYVGTPGDLKVETADGSVLTFVSASGFIPGVVTKVFLTGTSAQNIIALK
jgi:hypothetical protein